MHGRYFLIYVGFLEHNFGDLGSPGDPQRISWGADLDFSCFGMAPGTLFFRYVGPVSRFRGLNLRPEVVGCFLSDLGMNIFPKYEGRM